MAQVQKLIARSVCYSRDGIHMLLWAILVIFIALCI